MKKQVLIIEDHPVVAYTLSRLIHNFNSHLTIIVCECAKSAIDLVRNRGPWHRIFVDLNVPGAHGLSLIRKLNQMGVAGQCAVVTTSDEPQWIAQVKGFGCLDYIVKNKSIHLFQSSIEAALAGRSEFHQSPPDTQNYTKIFLTRRQQDILSLLLRGYSSKKIGAQLGITTGTVDNHVTGILRALGVTSRTHAVVKALSCGYALDSTSVEA